MIDLTEWTLRNVRDSLRDSVVSDKLGYLYMPLGKAANTEIKRLLWDIECANGYETAAPDAYFAVHNNNWTKSNGQSPSPWQCYKETEISRFLDDAESKFLFSVVRNPYLKLLSGYFDKVVNMQQEQDPDKRDMKRSQHNLPIVPESFEEFVEIVCQQSNDVTNIHWTGQRFALLYDFLDYDYIGHLEDLQGTFGLLSRKYAFSFVERENIAIHRTSAMDKFSQNYTPDLMAKVHRRYLEDFETFGYEPEPTQGTFNPVVNRSAPGSKRRFARMLGEITVELRASRLSKAREILSSLRESAGDELVVDSRIQKALSPNRNAAAPKQSASDARVKLSPPDFMRRIPDSIKVMNPRAKAAEISEIKKIRGKFGLAVSGAGNAMEYVRAFRVARNLRTYIEVGSRDKANIAYLCQNHLADDALIIDVNPQHTQPSSKLLLQCVKKSQEYRQIEGKSVSEEVISSLNSQLSGGKADLIFLDSSNFYSHFMDEFAIYWKFLRPGGILLVRDIFWEGNSQQKGKAQVADLFDRYIPTYCLLKNHEVSRFHFQAGKDDVFGGFGIFLKERGE